MQTRWILLHDWLGCKTRSKILDQCIDARVNFSAIFPFLGIGAARGENMRQRSLCFAALRARKQAAPMNSLHLM
jgi:hypothetical protein